MPAATAHGDELFFKGWPGLPVEVVAPADAVAAFRNEALSKAPPVLNPESTDGRPWGQPLKQPEGAPLNLG